MVLSPLGGSNTDLHALEALAEYLQQANEQRSRVLARELHDHLGASLVATIMDVAWLTRHAPPAADELLLRLHRIDGSLTKAIECTRRLVDELQPALIDSVGLFVAVSGHLRRECRRHAVEYRETVTGVAPDVDAGSSMAAFRIAQEFLEWTREEARAKELYARYEGELEGLSMRFAAQGIPAGSIPSQGIVPPRLASIALRLRKLNGTLSVEPGDSTVSIHVQIPANASHPQIAA